MKKVRSYISMLMLALLLLPMVQKGIHDLEHLEHEICAAEEVHFCKTEHTCNICDYVFSSVNSLDKPIELKVNENYSEREFSLLTFYFLRSPNYTFSLRGPPVC